jgi:hypothetical protein
LRAARRWPSRPRVSTRPARDSLFTARARRLFDGYRSVVRDVIALLRLDYDRVATT